MNKYDDMPPIILRSRGLNNALLDLDDYILSLEENVEGLIKERDELRKEIGDKISQDFKDSQQMMVSTLLACIGTPPVESLGTVGATLLARIRDMKTIEEVHEFINETFDEMKTEMKNED